MSVSYLLKYIFYVFIIFCLVSHRFPVGIRVLNGGGGAGAEVLVPNSRAFFMTIPHAEHPSSLILKPFSFPIPLQDFSESCLSSDGQFTYPVNKFRVFPNPASRVKSRIPRNSFQTLQDQLGVYICCIHAYDKASALKGI